jgi:hypothetical protein
LWRSQTEETPSHRINRVFPTHANGNGNGKHHAMVAPRHHHESQS